MMEFGYRGFGRIKPNYISVYGEQLEITECYQAEKYGFFQLVVNGLFADWQTWCLGRADTKKWYGYADSGSDSSGYAQWNEYSIFTNADVGNVIPIWLADSTPPGTKIRSVTLALVRLVSSNCHLYREVA